MKRVVLFSVAIAAIGIIPAMADYCQQTEKTLKYQITGMGQINTIEKNARAARVYSAMANRGCKSNSKANRRQAQANIQAARALIEAADIQNRHQRILAEDYVNQAAKHTWDSPFDR